MHTRDHTHPATNSPPSGPARPQPPAGDAVQAPHVAQRASPDHPARETGGPGQLEYASWLQLIRHPYA